MQRKLSKQVEPKPGYYKDQTGFGATKIGDTTFYPVIEIGPRLASIEWNMAGGLLKKTQEKAIISVKFTRENFWIKKIANKKLDIPILAGNIRMSSFYNHLQNENNFGRQLRANMTKNQKRFFKGLAARSLAILLEFTVRLWNMEDGWIALEASGGTYKQPTMNHNLVEYYEKLGFKLLLTSKVLKAQQSSHYLDTVVMHASIAHVLDVLKM